MNHDHAPHASDTSLVRVRGDGSPPDFRRNGPEAEWAERGDLLRYWSIVWNRRLQVLAVFAVVTGAAWLAIQRQAPVYRATGMIELRQPGDEVVPVEALFQLPRISDQHLETQYALLRSPALARRVAADLELDEEAAAGAELGSSDAAAPAPAGPDASAPGETGSGIGSLETWSRWIQDGLLVDPIRGSRLVRISFDATDPDLAADVVNSVLRQYSAMRLDAARGAVEQLAAQADSARTRLREAEDRLQRFVRGNGLLLAEVRPEGNVENIQQERLRRLQQELTAAESERYRAEVEYDLLREGGLGALDSGTIQSLNQRIAELRAEYARLRSTFTDEYPRTRQVRDQLDELEALLEHERGRLLAEAEADYRNASGREDRLREAFETQKGVIDGLAEQSAEYEVLQREVEAHLDLHATLQRQRNEAEVSAAMAATEIAVVQPASLPSVPIRPTPARDLPLAAIVGLGLGIALAFLREYTDTAIRTAEEVQSVSDVPVLAMIPSARALGRRSGSASDEDRRLLAEAFGGLRTSVLFDMHGVPPRSLLITSARPQEGKSTVSVNLAISLAKLGRRVLVIDADTRRPSLHRAFEVEKDEGLADHLSDQASWRSAVRHDVVPGLDLLTAGRSPDDPADLLSSQHMAELVQEAEAEYDFVILDSPALLINAADARILASLVDGVVLVVRSGATSRESLRNVVGRTPRIIGMVLNDLDLRSFDSYYGQYGELPPPGRRAASGTHGTPA